MLKDIKEKFKIIERFNEKDGGNFLKIKSSDYLLANNQVITREEIVKKNAVSILGLTSDNKIILAIEPRVLTKEQVSVGLPAGYINDGEEAIDAAKRELLEETGYEANDLVYLGYHYQDQGCSRAVVHSYLARDIKKVQEQQLDHDEYIKCHLASTTKVLEMIDKGVINDANSMVTIFKAKEKGYLKMFDAKKQVEGIINFIRDYYTKNNLYGVVLGISGGKDSAVVSALFTKALGADKVVGVTLPCHSKEEDKIDAKLISDHFGFKLLNIELTDIFDNFKESTGHLNMESVDADINLKPRLRMSSLYYLAQQLTTNTKKPYLVAGTSNLCELYVGYFTKGGDNVHDISVLADFSVDEVIKIGEYLGVPEKVLYKAPSDGLSNLTDEAKLGVTYKDIYEYIQNGELENKEVEQKIIKLHNKNQHKFNIPTYRKNQ